MENNPAEFTKCYKSISCIISILIIVFILGSILYDLLWSKPKMRRDISNINQELKIINKHIEKIDSQQVYTATQFMNQLKKDNDYIFSKHK